MATQNPARLTLITTRTRGLLQETVPTEAQGVDCGLEPFHYESMSVFCMSAVILCIRPHSILRVPHECLIEPASSSETNVILPMLIFPSSCSAEYCPSYKNNVQATYVECQTSNQNEISVWTLTITITSANLVDGHGFCSPDTLVA